MNQIRLRDALQQPCVSCGVFWPTDQLQAGMCPHCTRDAAAFRASAHAQFMASQVWLEDALARVRYPFGRKS